MAPSESHIFGGFRSQGNLLKVVSELSVTLNLNNVNITISQLVNLVRYETRYLNPMKSPWTTVKNDHDITIKTSQITLDHDEIATRTW